MARLFGVFDRGGSKGAEPIARRMLAAMRHHSWYGETLNVSDDGALAWGGLTIGGGPLASKPSASGLTVLLDGEIYDYDVHRGRLEREGAVFGGREHAEVLAHGIARHGESFLRGLEGYFAAAVWHPATTTLTLVNDRFGMKPLYYATVDNGFVFASEIKALLKHPGISRTLSLRGVSQFFTFGHHLTEDTLFEKIATLAPAAVVQFDGTTGAVTLGRYWRMEPTPLVDSESEALTMLDECFGRAVERRTAGDHRLGLSLSGGLDARTILAAVPQGRQIKSISLGIPGSIDHRAASELARLAGAQHHCHFLQNDFLDRFPGHLQSLVHLTDGHYLDQAITVPTLPVYRELGIDVVLRGHAGELFHMDKAYAFSIKATELDFPSPAGLEAWLWSHLSDYMIAGLGHDAFKPAIRAEVGALARASLRDAIKESDRFEPLAQRLWHLFVSQRLRRETAMSMQMFSSVVEIRLPYLDNDVVDAVLRIAPSMKMGDRIQSFILSRRKPAFLSVVNANTGTHLGAHPWERRLSTARLRVLSKLGVPGYQPYERLGLWLSRELQPYVRALLLSDRSFSRGLFEPSTVQKIIEDHASRARNHTFLLMAMLIFEVGQRQLVDDDLGQDADD